MNLTQEQRAALEMAKGYMDRSRDKWTALRYDASAALQSLLDEKGGGGPGERTQAGMQLPKVQSDGLPVAGAASTALKRLGADHNGLGGNCGCLMCATVHAAIAAWEKERATWENRNLDLANSIASLRAEVERIATEMERVGEGRPPLWSRADGVPNAIKAWSKALKALGEGT